MWGDVVVGVVLLLLLLLLTFDVHWNYFGFAVVLCVMHAKGEAFQLFLFASMQIAASSASPSFPPTPLLLELRFGLSGHGPKNYVPAGFAFVVLRPYSALLPTVLPTVTVYAVTILPSISSCSKFVVSQLLK